MTVLLALSAFASSPPEDVDPPAWGAVAAEWVVRIAADRPPELSLEARFAAIRPGWLEVPLAGPGLVVSEVSGPVTAAPSGVHVLLPPGAPTATVRVRGTVEPRTPGQLSLAVAPLPGQRVRVEAPGFDVTVAGAVDGVLAASDRLEVRWVPHVDVAPAPPAPVVTAETANAVWGEAGGLAVRSIVRWRVLRGQLERFTLDVGTLDELEIEGAGVRRWSRAGSTVTIEATGPVRGLFEARVKARAPRPEGEWAVPSATPTGVRRVDRWWTLGRSDEDELVPVGGPSSVAARALPDWARGLSETTPLANWHGTEPVRLRAARYDPVMGPDTVIEQAAFVMATSREGRALLRATWRVRNERRQYLHVRPPPGFRPVTARVSGVPVTVLSDGGSGVYVPLEKSVETVQGFLTFPVEISWIAEEAGWERKGERIFTLPAVDAPIQSVSWEVHLPRGVESPGAVASVPVVTTEEDEAEEVMLRAVSSYKGNKFDEAQEWLDQARALGADDANVDRLQSNLDVLLDGVSGGEGSGRGSGSSTRAESPPEDVASRRVRDLANAKTVQMQVVQQEKTEEARKAMASGDYDKASAYLEEVVELAKDIGVTEQRESAEQGWRMDEAQKALEVTKKAKQQRAAELEEPVIAFGRDAPVDEEESTFAFEDLPNKGELDLDGHMDWHGGDDTEPSPVVVVPEPSSTTFNEEFVSSVPTGRSRERVAAGTEGRPGGGNASGESSVVPVVVPEAAASTPRTDPVTGTFSLEYEEDARVSRAPRPPASGKSGGKGPSRPAVEAPPPPPMPPAEPKPAAPEAQDASRAPLEVKATPLTVALPLGGALVRAEQALLPADAFPTLTIPFKSGEPR